MDVAIYQLDGKSARSVPLPGVFSGEYRTDLVRRGLLAEQSLSYQPQAHSVMAGIDTTAVYIGRYDASWRRGRHMGQAIRPRQALGGGAQGDVRRIPSATKGRRAHPHKLERKIVESINRKEYRRAVEAAIAGCAKPEVVKKNHRFKANSLPIVVDDAIEKVAKTKELMKVLGALGLLEDVERSHDPSIRKGLRRASRQRRWRRNVLIVAADAERIGRAGRNIPGLDVSRVSELTVGKLAPGANPRVTVWSVAALRELEHGLDGLRLGVEG